MGPPEPSTVPNGPRMSRGAACTDDLMSIWGFRKILNLAVLSLSKSSQVSSIW